MSTTSYHRDDRDLGSAWSHRGPSDFPFDVNLLVLHPDQMTDFVLDSGTGLVPRSLHHRALGVGPAGAVVVDGRRGAHGARGLDPHLVGARERLLGVRRPCPLRPHPGRRGALRAGSGRTRPAGRLRLRVQRRLRERVRPAESSWAPCEAYTAAFSPKDGHHLVIDASHADRYPQEHALLVSLADGRPDVAIRDRLSATARDRLVACADCYLSLHRADGGLGSVAKAMSWGTFTVVTATPESLEFQTDQDSGLVRSETVAVPADEYRYPSGSSWADPDLEHASSILQAVVGDPDGTAAKVRRARRLASRRFSPSVARAAVHARLVDIDARLHAGHRSDRVSAARVRHHAGGRR